ncbi:hypothetical protein JRO89_XS07G0061200 [Xanthoceras sorbifolium]|uniref:Inactive heme oxygenase 2, chloroplastic n=1 Tax=Xanthoceras sorbifolium TaxID=99658 RepID=A0ABQ8HSQ5_9ROSI|nr:hypothetical protein JRO89_XS07G0061200 [Xanthoceras sorbifolium]
MPLLWSCKIMSMQHSLVHSSFSVSSSLSLPSKFTIPTINKNQKCSRKKSSPPLILCCSDPSLSSTATSSTTTTNSTAVILTSNGIAPPVVKKRKRYRKLYPGENQGITEEMRFVAMRLRNIKGKNFPSLNTNSDSEYSQDSSDDDEEVEGAAKEDEEEEEAKEDDSSSVDSAGETWKPSMEGFVKYLVDTRLVFNTIERIVDESDDVACKFFFAVLIFFFLFNLLLNVDIDAYFRKTGLERAEGISKDLEWFSEQGIVIPDPSTPGVSYAKYLEEIAEKSAPLFLSHFYNIYFSHIAGGQVIAKRVSEKILEGRELEINKWDGDAEELLKGVREKLNMLGEVTPESAMYD